MDNLKNYRESKKAEKKRFEHIEDLQWSASEWAPKLIETYATKYGFTVKNKKHIHTIEGCTFYEVLTIDGYKDFDKFYYTIEEEFEMDVDMYEIRKILNRAFHTVVKLSFTEIGRNHELELGVSGELCNLAMPQLHLNDSAKSKELLDAYFKVIEDEIQYYIQLPKEFVELIEYGERYWN